MIPDLSIAIIFKNEIRCLERCLQSVQPLRERLSCEIVMADTGSTDGSRAVAERYANRLFDFPWINDFSAARNAVLDRCAGRWILVLDCDEWLDSEAAELCEFLLHPASEGYTSAMLTVRSYLDDSLSGYSDRLLKRLLNSGANPRFVGAIHERPEFSAKTDNVAVLASVTLHHDGYVAMNGSAEDGSRKRERNRTLLREELRRDPDNLERLHQYLEAGGGEDYGDVLRHAVGLLREKRDGWSYYGPAILKTAALYGYSADAPELDEWLALAEELFPDSWQTRIDGETVRMLRADKRGDAAGVVRCGEKYLAACADYDAAGPAAMLCYGTLLRANLYYRQFVRIRAADACRRLNEFERSLHHLDLLAWDELDDELTGMALNVLARLSDIPGLQTAPTVRAFWTGILREKPNPEAAKKRKQSFLRNGTALFDPDAAGEPGAAPWRVFLTLRGECPLGDSAALLAAETAEEADAVLSGFEDVTLLPGRALAHGLELGAAFPVPGKPLTVEAADALARRLAADGDQLRSLALLSAAAAEDEQDILWACALVRAAVRSANWEADPAPLDLLAACAHIESLFLPLCYSAKSLKSPEWLPPEHRFGLHLANACSVLLPGTGSSDFAPALTDGLSAALGELKEAVRSVPVYKAAIDRLLDDLTKRSG